MTPQPTHRDAIEQSVGILLILLENTDVLEDLLLDLDSLVEPDRVLAQEVEDDIVWRLKSDVLASQGTTANGIRLIFAFLVTGTKREFVK